MTKLSLALSALAVGSASAFSMNMKADTGANSRRDILQKGAAIATAIAAPAAANAYAVPDLLYPFDALEPFIDAPTMKIHHDKHHATYVANINKATEGKEEVDILELQLNALEAGPVRNSGGGHYNHAFFWDEMAPPDQAAKSKISPELEAAIEKSFGSVDEMKAKFEAQAAPGAVFGSGWVWVCVSSDGLKLVGTPNQDNPLMKGVTDEVMFPILGLDVWEHAYYLKYQNRRPEYVSAWWNVVNWDKVSENFAYVSEKKAGVPVRG
eukprot:CAMPEP_0201606716 /NCGR_PEP_ID=MMETSP0492-20130828/6073_1 /ASSEMBLY_ACC=CAM_ASM_000837 /TAXON_ID=420259 /ORGANISM="Thalassiosira gravida, Strain GMp14c1" /LENGTH=266 /DNA_ID=CAMNT_0048071179 /DNA_START=67 /DNA_END=867 /DNA_ORIENTATION=-